MDFIPPVRYAKNGDLMLAYQVLGSGATDLVYVLFETPTVVGSWLVPEPARFLRRLASFSRLVVTDRRGMGCSDRLPPGTSPSLDELVDDLLTVMEDASASRPVLVAGLESAFVAMAAAARHPDRFAGLVLFGPAPSWHRTAAVPWERSDDGWAHDLGVIRKAVDLRTWAHGFVRSSIPSRALDASFVSKMEALSALSGTPEAWYWDQRLFAAVDLTEVLPEITVRTLVLVKPRAGWPDARSSRLVADLIPGATIEELPGNDTLPWMDEADAAVAAIQEFVTGSREGIVPERHIATVVFTDLVSSTQRSAELGDAGWKRALEAYRTAVRSGIARHGGREISTSGDGFLITFGGPASAARCAAELVAATRRLGLEMRAGVHTGEVESIDGEIGGIGVTIGARVGALAGASEVLVTSTVRDLTVGADLRFEDAGDHQLKGVPGRWRLYRLAIDDAATASRLDG
ncbi:MAG TPA: adenylate/guanylate cyclase domain-containing protein [Candidatus Deferrimicrobiaceae bacterium]|nr:adenylate/guanylate cyclase domain-containing protein [Candidatus Deferrimicrobiaceae bacterium]